jgi:hypothetical protein
VDATFFAYLEFSYFVAFPKELALSSPLIELIMTCNIGHDIVSHGEFRKEPSRDLEVHPTQRLIPEQTGRDWDALRGGKWSG